ncbi:hypothetical protein ACIQV3_08375 [Streptomyces sp. NPDC099050]|uniref:hypothetical protein n=1 Tax=Streptomyces sp. NPDC099050 TaxID=3366100 RepID=UPI003801D5D1
MPVLWRNSCSGRRPGGRRDRPQAGLPARRPVRDPLTMSESLRQLLYVVIVAGILAVVVIGVF